MNGFAKYIKIIGQGKQSRRSLSFDEAYAAMTHICCYDLNHEQLGAFWMLLRVKDTNPEEMAGLTQALRDSIPNSGFCSRPSIDWPAYAGKREHSPWFVMAALTAAKRGYPVFMHGICRDDGRHYAETALAALGIYPAKSLGDADYQLMTQNFSYLPLSRLAPLAAEMLNLRDQFGVRPPLLSLARMLNTFSAPLSLIGVNHAHFAPLHQRALQRLGQGRSLISQGNHGEFEANPGMDSHLYCVDATQTEKYQWRAHEQAIDGSDSAAEGVFDTTEFARIWRGEHRNHRAETTVISTLARVICGLGLQTQARPAHRLARDWWQQRHHNTSFRPQLLHWDNCCENSSSRPVQASRWQKEAI